MSGMALEDVRVLDLTQMIAGPYCTRLMALYGAEVIKVERPGSGDRARSANEAAFLYLNTGKKSVTLNLKSAAGKELFTRLARESDILVENFRPGTMERFGFGYEALARINPDLVMVSVSNFGQTGPYRNYKATELNLQAWAGIMHLGGERGREPLRLGFSAAQYMAGQNASTLRSWIPR
jgi:crotonobetainyl-CoA:carnitine CoA-transferase CaiB-like acyl-CoA transferase